MTGTQTERPPRLLLIVYCCIFLFYSRPVCAQSSLTSQRCVLYLAASDLSRDSSLNREPEFARFVTIVAGTPYATYAAVPTAYQSLYEKYAASDTGEISVEGARTGAPPDGVTSLCDEVISILEGPVPGASATTTGPAAPITATTPPDTGTSTGAPVAALAIPFTTCRTNMAVSDSNRDNQLTQTEFTTFLNRLTVSQRGFATFAGLPANIQQVFVSLATDEAPAGEIGIAGASPALFASATDAQKEFLEKICRDVQAALDGEEGIGGEAATQAPDAVVATTIPPASTLTPNVVVTSPDIPFAQCRVSLAVADANRDKALTEVEYVGFLNRLTSNAYANTLFTDLSAALKNNFNTLAMFNAPSEAISIAGSLPAEYDVATAEQKAFLQRICDDTQTITIGNGPGVTNPPGTLIPSVTTPLGISPPGVMVLTLNQCRPSMFIADADRDTLLNKEEYAVFVNRLVPTTSYPNFDSLTPFLQQNYDALAASSDRGQISVFGATPAQPADAIQIGFLEKVCTDTQVAAAAGGPATSAVSTIAPTPIASAASPSPAPLEGSQLTTTSAPIFVAPTYQPIDLIACGERIRLSDDNADGRIDQTEYVNLLIQLSNNELFLTSTYDSLSESLKTNFLSLSDNDGLSLNVEGASPGVNNTDEVLAGQFLTVCGETMAALNAFVQEIAIQDAAQTPTLAPSSALSTSVTPTPAPGPTAVPTAFDGTVTVYSSFIIYNVVGILADTLNTQGNPDRRDLELAYIGLARNVVAENVFPPAETPVPIDIPGGTEGVTSSEAGRKLKLSHIRRRELLALKVGSARILELEDRECPQELLVDPRYPLAESCQTVYAWYEVYDVVSGSQESAYTYFTDETQESFNNGDFASILDSVNRNARIEVYGATDDLVIWTAPPTQSPVRINTSTDEDGGINSTVLFVCLVGLVSLCALGVYFAWNDKDKIRERWREFKKKDDPKDEEEGGSQGELLQGNDEVQYEIGEDGKIVYPEGYEEEDFEVEEYEDEFDVEQAGGKKKKVRPKKLLGKLGKGVVQVGKHARAFVNEHDMDLEEMEAIGFQDENLLDFEDYVFDTPAELLVEQNAANKPTDEVVGKEGGIHREDGKGTLTLSQSFVAGMQPANLAASSASEMDDSDFSGDDFDDEYDSYDDSEEHEDEVSFDLEFSESDAGKGEDSISTKDDKFGDVSLKDDDSLSSTEDQLPSALVGEGVEDMLARASSGKGAGENGDGDSNENDSDDSGSDASSWGSASTTISAEERLASYREEVKDLVSKVIPEELDNLSTMMDQFEGREAELINTLQNMEERTSTQRARAAVHKTRVKVNPNQVGGYSIASEGSAVIAAASTLGPEPQRRQPRVQQDYYDDDYDSQEGSYYSDDYDSQEGSYYSDEYDSQEGSYYSGEGDSHAEGEGSYYSDEDRSYTDAEGSYYDDEIPEGEEESYYSEDQSGGSSQQGGSSYSDGEGSYYDDEILKETKKVTIPKTNRVRMAKRKKPATPTARAAIMMKSLKERRREVTIPVTSQAATVVVVAALIPDLTKIESVVSIIVPWVCDSPCPNFPNARETSALCQWP